MRVLRGRWQGHLGRVTQVGDQTRLGQARLGRGRGRGRGRDRVGVRDRLRG